MGNMSEMALMIGSDSSMTMGGMVDNNSNSSMNTHSMNMSSTMNMNDESNKNYSLSDMTDHQSAQALATKAQDIFKIELKPIAPINSLAFVINLENGLTQLNNSIKNKASPMDVMTIGHTQVHPNLLEAFNLQLQMKM